jgi:hypothetical protein
VFRVLQDGDLRAAVARCERKRAGNGRKRGQQKSQQFFHRNTSDKKILQIKKHGISVWDEYTVLPPNFAVRKRTASL